jgi:hypothetical protein
MIFPARPSETRRTEKPLQVPHPHPDETCRKSPQPTAQPGEHLVTRDELYFAPVDLADTALDLHPPSLFNIRIGWAVKRFNE